MRVSNLYKIAASMASFIRMIKEAITEYSVRVKIFLERILEEKR